MGIRLISNLRETENPRTPVKVPDLAQLRRTTAAKMTRCCLTLLVAWIISVVIVSAVVVGVLTFSNLDARSLWIKMGWSVLCDETIHMVANSPDGQYTAEVVRVNCGGAAGGRVTHARLTRHGDWALGFKSALVYTYRGIPTMEIIWEDFNHLLIKFTCKGAAQAGQSWEGVTFEFQRVEPVAGQCRFE